MEYETIEKWLSPLDAAALECDGLSRVASALLHRERISHKIIVGSLDIDGVGRIPLHFWIAFDDGSVCDFRARMWLGDSQMVPHGVFMPVKGQIYNARDIDSNRPLDAFVFHILSGCELSEFASLH